MKPDAIVGGPKSDIPGSKQYACAGCGTQIWLAPSGQQAAEEGTRVICLACCLTEMGPHDNAEFCVLRGALNEVRDYAIRIRKN